MSEDLRELGQPIADQLEAMPLADVMSILAFVTGAMMSRPELDGVSIEELLVLHCRCTAPNIQLLRAARADGQYPFEKKVSH